MRFELEIGEHEKHKISYYFDKIFGKLEIKVDDMILYSDFIIISVGLSDVHDFRIGQMEVHAVRIEKIRPRFWAGFRTNTYRVYVDGLLIKEYKD